MTQPEKILKDMDQILDGLIENAKTILKASQRVIAEEELSQLQREQNVLVEQLVTRDAEFNKCSAELPQAKLDKLRDNIDKKIDQFQKLNSEFVDNINASQGLIQFEKGRIKKPTK